MSEQYKTRPSNLLGIDDPYAAFCVDEAIYIWGSYVDSELDKVGDRDMDRKAKAKLEQRRNARQQRYEQLMAGHSINRQRFGVSGAPQQFRDPMSLFSKGQS
jgi:hypothetical protein